MARDWVGEEYQLSNSPGFVLCTSTITKAHIDCRHGPENGEAQEVFTREFLKRYRDYGGIANMLFSFGTARNFNAEHGGGVKTEIRLDFWALDGTVPGEGVNQNGYKVWFRSVVAIGHYIKNPGAKVFETETMYPSVRLGDQTGEDGNPIHWSDKRKPVPYSGLPALNPNPQG